MSEDKDKKAPEEGEERTVFMPSIPDAPTPPIDSEAPTTPPAGAGEESPPAAPEPAPPEGAAGAGGDAGGAGIGETIGEGEERTTFMPSLPDAPPARGGGTPEVAAAPAPEGLSDKVPVAPGEPTAPVEEAAAPAAGTGFVPRQAERPIEVGDVLNHIFEVKRFLARGGMGEVFEGCNVNTDERVAIKVMLPAMAADEKVVAMFRKEARTLTKLQHEALVQYRVLAQEPQLGVLYIVTEFIEGVELGEVLAQQEWTPEQQASLLKRLASGLAAAHRLGAIHRDMSPDNVLLPGGDFSQAKVIDFGIAKDLDASSATIVGDGFAGKLNYVAPEQLGDFGRDIGPWTDVYSLGLVMLAVAQGKNVNMSGSLVDAIDKRRKGPDLSPVPDDLRPILDRMLRPDPKERMRSMEEVLAALSGQTAPPTPLPGADSAPVPVGRTPKALILGGVAAAAIVIGAGGWYMFAGGGSDGEVAPGGNAAAGMPVPVASPEESARAAVNSVLPSVGCTWLDIAAVQSGGNGVTVAMRGVAGDAGAAQREIGRALAGAGMADARVDFGDVAPITPAGCAALDTYRQVRASSGYKLSAGQPRYEMVTQPPRTRYAGQEAANAVIDFNFAEGASDFAILGIEPSGAITGLIPNRATFDRERAQSVEGRPIEDVGNGRYRLHIDLDHQGWSGIILVTGQGPFDPDLVAPPFGQRGPAWQERFLTAASQGNWRVEMAWFESVNRE